jgi:hypothetical protein
VSEVGADEKTKMVEKELRERLPLLQRRQDGLSEPMQGDIHLPGKAS